MRIFPLSLGIKQCADFFFKHGTADSKLIVLCLVPLTVSKFRIPGKHFTDRAIALQPLFILTNGRQDLSFIARFIIYDPVGAESAVFGEEKKNACPFFPIKTAFQSFKTQSIDIFFWRCIEQVLKGIFCQQALTNQ